MTKPRGNTVRPIRVPGTIQRVVPEKGFGFIRDAAGTDYFFHRSACAAIWPDLAAGTAVTFEVAQGQKGPRAESIELQQ